MIDLSALRGSRSPGAARWTALGSAEELEALPLTHRDQLLFLDRDSTREAYELAARHRVVCGDPWGNEPFGGGCYDEVERYRMGAEAEVKKWLYRRGLPFRLEVLVLPVFGTEDEPALLTTWKMVVKYAGLFFSRDNLVVFGSAADWCLYYHHDDILHFARRRFSR